jgi:hypothetical protein
MGLLSGVKRSSSFSGEGEGVGDGTGEGTGEGMGDGTGEGMGEGTGEGMGEGTGEGTAEGTGEGTGEGESDGEDTTFVSTPLHLPDAMYASVVFFTHPNSFVTSGFLAVNCLMRLSRPLGPFCFSRASATFWGTLMVTCMTYLQ